ncbi:murein biosynthesis integral membrane protein MurJ [Savagea serpentis]|uniref:murein biosynthesis integral membrane protein MurJ n=1 Tax=Savagea serpentis TaxID=2785297 RepID=UPI001BCA0F81|nr:lipid II flippase MurJ [Savagea serpentis]
MKLSGFIREAVIAREFGASSATDAYVLSFGFITLAITLTASGFNNVFLPLYVKERQKGEGASDANANALLNGSIVLFIVLSIIGVLFTETIVGLLFGPMIGDTKVLTIDITRVFFTMLTFVGLSAILDSYLQSRRIFVPSQFAKLSATLSAAIAALLFSDTYGIFSVVYGFGFGTIVGVVIQLYYLMRSNYEWRLQFKLTPDFKKTFFLLLIPALLHSAVGQINLFVDRSFASNTVDAAATYLNNASLIASIPHAIFATTIVAIIFTLLSEQHDNIEQFRKIVFKGLQISALTLLPIAVGLLVLGESFISFVYERGKFTAEDTHRTYIVLLLYLPFVIFQGFQFILAKTIFTMQKTKLIFRVSMTTIVINWTLNYFLVDRFSYPALAVSTSIVTLYLFTMSLFIVYREIGFSELTRFFKMLAFAIPPAAVMGGVLYICMEWTFLGSLTPLVQLVLLIPLGVIVYVASLYVVYRQGFRDVMHLLRRA